MPDQDTPKQTQTPSQSPSGSTLLEMAPKFAALFREGMPLPAPAAPVPPAETEAQPSESSGAGSQDAASPATAAENEVAEAASPSTGTTKPGKSSPAPTPAEPATTPAEPEPPRARVISKGSERRLDAEQLTAVATEAATRAATAAAQQANAPAKPAVEPAEFSAREQRDLAVFGEMSRLYPETYQGLDKRYQAYLREVREIEKNFRQRWERSNPPEEGEGDREEALQEAWDKEQARLEKKHGLDYDEADRADAIAVLRVKPVEERAKQAEAQNQSLREELRSQRVLPKVVEQARQSAAAVLQELSGAEAAKAIRADGSVDSAQLLELDPVSAPVLGQAADATARWTAAVSAAFNGIANPQQLQAADQFCSELEERLGALPAEQRTDEAGRVFASLNEWNSLSPEQQRRRWRLTEDFAAEVKRIEILNGAKQQVEVERKRFENYEKRARKNGAAAPAASEAKPVAAAAPAPPAASPSISASPMPGPAAAAPAPSGSRLFFDAMKSGTTMK